MAHTTLSLDNTNKPAPRWFRRLKKAFGILTIAANVMVAQWPTGDEMLKLRLQLWLTIGIGAILEALEALLANGEEYARAIDTPPAPSDGTIVGPGGSFNPPSGGLPNKP